MASLSVLEPLKPLLSPKGWSYLTDADDAYSALVVETPPHPAAVATLTAIPAADLLAGPVVDALEADAAKSGLLLWLDELHTSHTLMQEITTPTGSLWHAILHRREGDFSNSKYWLARSRGHAAVDAIARAVGETMGSDEPIPADAFVDAVARGVGKGDPPTRDRLAAAQRAEFAVLMEHTLKKAMGRG